MSDRNAYEAGLQKIIPAVLLYAFFEDQVLMIHRHGKENDFHEGKWNGLGGKLELGETPAESAAREFSEESGVSIPAARWNWAGALFFPNFKPHRNEDWQVTVLTTALSSEQMKKIVPRNEEGSLHWIKSDQILKLNLWEGDRIFLPLVLKMKPFQGTFFYEEGKVSRFFCDPILG